MIKSRYDISIGDYLTDETRLYRVNRVITGTTANLPVRYLVENCFTEHDVEMSRSTVIKMRKIDSKQG